VATARESRRLRLSNATGTPIDHMNMIGAQIAFSRDGKLLAASSQRDGTIFLLDAISGTENARVDGSEDMFKSLVFSPDGQILATQFSSSRIKREAVAVIRLWDIASRREICRFNAHRNAITALMFTPDGARLISASEDSTVFVWDVPALTGRGKAGASTVPRSKEGIPSSGK
jgi:WD40 repeat protein